MRAIALRQIQMERLVRALKMHFTGKIQFALYVIQFSGLKPQI